MTMTITIAFPAIWLFVVLSAMLFVCVTVLCWREGMFKEDIYGLGRLFAIFFYSFLWLFPSLLAWSIWATWFQ